MIYKTPKPAKAAAKALKKIKYHEKPNETDVRSYQFNSNMTLPTDPHLPQHW